MTSPTVIVYGPPGCGKTLRKEAIRRHFSCPLVIDEWQPGQRLTIGAVHLTNAQLISMPDDMPNGVRWVRFDALPVEVRKGGEHG